MEILYTVNSHQLSQKVLCYWSLEWYFLLRHFCSKFCSQVYRHLCWKLCFLRSGWMRRWQKDWVLPIDQWCNKLLYGCGSLPCWPFPKFDHTFQKLIINGQILSHWQHQSYCPRKGYLWIEKVYNLAARVFRIPNVIGNKILCKHKKFFHKKWLVL